MDKTPMDVEETFAVVRVLDDAQYMDLCADVQKRRYDTARWLLQRGIDSKGVRLLRLYAERVATSNPDGLFAHWLANPTRAEKKLRECLAKPAFVASAKERMRLQDEPLPAAPVIPMRRQA